MSNKSLSPTLAALMGALLSGRGVEGMEVVAVEVREGESIEEAVARTHRESCEDCAAEHEAAMKEKNATSGNVDDRNAARQVTDGVTGLKSEMRKKLRAQHEHEVKQLAVKHDKELEQFGHSFAADERVTGMRPEMAMAYGEGSNSTPARQPIGFMVFHVRPDGTAKAVPPSFNESRKVVEEALAEVEQHPIAMLMSGLSGTHTEIRPVFGE